MALTLTVDFVPLSSQPCPNPLLPDLGSLSQLFTFFWYSISQTVICKEAESESPGKLSDNTDSETISITATLNKNWDVSVLHGYCHEWNPLQIRVGVLTPDVTVFENGALWR